MGYSEKKKAYNIEYKKNNLKRVPLDLPIEKYHEVKTHSEKQNETVNGFIKRAIDETMDRDNS